MDEDKQVQKASALGRTNQEVKLVFKQVVQEVHRKEIITRRTRTQEKMYTSGSITAYTVEKNTLILQLKPACSVFSARNGTMKPVVMIAIFPVTCTFEALIHHHASLLMNVWSFFSKFNVAI